MKNGKIKNDKDTNGRNKIALKYKSEQSNKYKCSEMRLEHWKIQARQYLKKRNMSKRCELMIDKEFEQGKKMHLLNIPDCSSVFGDLE